MPKTLDKDIHSGIADAISSSQNKELICLDSGGDYNGHVKICLKVFLSFTGDSPATNVTLTPHVPSYIFAAPVNMVIDTVSGSNATPMVVKFYFYAKKNQIPTGIIIVLYNLYYTCTVTNYPTD